ncbi:MAG TPA: multidrug efflux RND transporter permease subunit [Gemmatimonadales bacterium]|nr:multidrug efflux RND transporter permease subunit [Gemmatimonadales bacterium]
MSNFFIRRPIVAIVIAIVTVIAGAVSIPALPIAQYPEIVPPQILVNTTYTGADAVTVEQSVATPIEQQMSGVDNMLYMQSTNANDGTMNLRVTYSVETSPDIDQVNTQNRLSQATSQLPSDVNNFGVTVRKSTTNPLMLISLYSPNGSYDPTFLGNYGTINLIDALYRVKGVGQVLNFGVADYAMRVWIRPDRLAKLGLTIPDLANAIKQQNTVNPAGRLGAEPAPPGQEFTYSVRAQGRLLTAEEFGEIVVRLNPDGSVVRLKDVSRIELGALTYNQIGRLNGKPSSIIGVFQAPGSNALAVSEGVRKVVADLSERFPNDLAYAISLDTTAPVVEGINEIVHTLLEATVLVIIVVFIFLQNWRATLIPLIAVPVSLIGTFAFFPMFGFSVNTLSLLGLVLAIGLVVDDAIVVVEAVELWIERGKSPKEATIKAMEEVSGPVIGIALVLSSVFIPAAFMAGIKGRLNQQFALTIAISVLISAFNALTLSPALAAMLLRHKEHGEKQSLLGRFFAGFNKWFAKITDGYVGYSRFFIRKMAISIALFAAFGVLAGLLGSRLPTSFVPDEDQGFFYMNVELPAAASLQRADAVSKQIEGILAQHEEIEYYNTVVGYSLLSQTAATYNSFFFVSLKEWKQRTGKGQDVKSLVAKINRELAGAIPGAVAFGFLPPAIPGIGTGSGLSFYLQDRSGGTPQFLAENTQKFMAALGKRPELAGLRTIYRAQVPQVFADVNRDKVVKQGVALADVYQTLQANLGGLYVNQFNRFGRVWKVFLQAEAEQRLEPFQIANFHVRNNSGSMVPLGAMVETSRVYGPEFTQRFNLFRAALISATPAAGYSTGDAMAAMEEVANTTLPRELGYDWTDMSYQEKHAGGSAGVLIMSVVFVFLVLAAQYESWTLPFSVLLTVPVAVFGAFVGMLLRRYDFDVFGQIGLVMLIGLAAKNAILIVEFAVLQMKEGKSLVEAALEGAKLRLRPILMTSFAFILGCVPLWIASGAGAISRRILGTTVIMGMLAATGLAIFIIPALFVLVERLSGTPEEGHKAEGHGEEGGHGGHGEGSHA